MEKFDTFEEEKVSNRILTLGNNSDFSTNIELPNLPPGNYRLKLVVDPEDFFDNEESEENNLGFSKPFRIISVPAVSFGFARLSCEQPSCYPDLNLSLFDLTSGETVRTEFNNLLPLKLGDLSFSKLAQQIGSANNTNTVTAPDGFPISFGMLDDARKLENLLLTSNLKKVFGVVSQGYFNYHFNNIPGPSPLGFAIRNKNLSGKVAFFNGEYGKNYLYHEFGHLVGGNHNSEGVIAYNNLADNPTYPAKRIMTGPNLLFPNDTVWISNEIYTRSLLSFLSPAVDPELLLVSGFYDSNEDKILLVEYSIEPEGTLSVSEAGGVLEVQGLNVDGNVISSVRLSTSKVAVVDFLGDDSEPSSIEIDLELVPFSAALPFNSNLASFRIANSNGPMYTELVVGPNSTFESLVSHASIDDFLFSSDQSSTAVRNSLVRFAGKIDLELDIKKRKALLQLVTTLKNRLSEAKIRLDKKAEILRAIERLVNLKIKGT